MSDQTKPNIDLEQRLALLEAGHAQLRNGSRTPVRWIWLGAVVGLLVTSTTLALTDAELGCTEGSGLACLRPGEPARASDVNANFSLLLSWLEGKIGSSEAPGVSVSGPSALAGNVTVAAAATLTVNGPTVLNGPVTVPAGLLKQSGPFSARMDDRHATDSKVMTNAARSMCFLTRYHESEIDLPSEWGACTISEVQGSWVLSAELLNTTNANIVCEARCLSW
jgi:hypothetical protein